MPPRWTCMNLGLRHIRRQVKSFSKRMECWLCKSNVAFISIINLLHNISACLCQVHTFGNWTPVKFVWIAQVCVKLHLLQLVHVVNYAFRYLLKPIIRCENQMEKILWSTIQSRVGSMIDDVWIMIVDHRLLKSMVQGRVMLGWQLTFATMYPYKHIVLPLSN